MKKQDEDDLIYETAVNNGCLPTWFDGVLGPAWHCNCADEAHYCDQQCSAITMESARSSNFEIKQITG